MKDTFRIIFFRTFITITTCLILTLCILRLLLVRRRTVCLPVLQMKFQSQGHQLPNAR